MASNELSGRSVYGVQPVTAERGLTEFLSLGEAWPALVRNEAPFVSFAESQAWYVEQDGQPVARVLGLVDRVTNEKKNEAVGHLALFEARPGCYRATQVLLWEAYAWLQARGCRRARFGFRPTVDMPLTIDAYGVTPTFLHRSQPPYYHGLVKSAGLLPGLGLIEYHLAFDDAWRERYEVTVDGARRRGITVRPAHDLETFTALLNECYAEHWGVPHYLPEEVAVWVDGAGKAEPAGYWLFAEVNGELAGATLGSPDLNHEGRGVLWEIMVRKPFRGLGVNYALAAQLFLTMMGEGIQEASYTLVLDTNRASRRTAENLGGVPARNYVVYEKEL